MQRRPLLSVACPLLLLLACENGGAGGDSQDSEGSITNPPASTTDESAGESDTESPTTGEPFAPIPARGGIKVSRVEANPGVAIALWRDGAAVGGAERNAYMPGDRDTMIRVYVDVPEDTWEARELEAHLHLVGGGVDKVFTKKLLVEGDSRDSGLESTFFFGVTAESIVPNLKFEVTLWETAPGQEDAPEGEVPPRAPYEGTGFVGVESSPQNMRLVVVPIDYSFGGCQAKVDPEEWRKKFEDALYQQNPLGTLDLEFREHFKVTWDMTKYNGLSQLVSEMSQLRADDGVDPNVYYYGLFDNCGQCIAAGDGAMSGCTLGLAANITGDAKSDGWGRASAGQIEADTEGTFVHEVGHTQGRRHIECAGAGIQAAGTDPSYPYSGGVIGVWGFGIRDFKLRHPKTHADYMSYCGSVWVSDWQWNATYQRIKTLSGWDMENAAPAEAGPGLLVGAIDEGQEMWWTVPGTLDDAAPRSATHAVDFVFPDRVTPAAAQVSVRPHGTTTNVVVPLPAGFDPEELQELVLRAPEGESVVVPERVRWLHRPDLKKKAP